MFYCLCHVHETSPGTHTLFPTYTCPVYCWRSVQLLDFGLSCSLIHASQPIRATFTGQCFASGFLQTPPHDDALAFGCTLPTAGRVRDFHPLERVPAGHTRNRKRPPSRRPFSVVLLCRPFFVFPFLNSAVRDACRPRSNRLLPASKASTSFRVLLHTRSGFHPLPPPCGRG